MTTRHTTHETRFDGMPAPVPDSWRSTRFLETSEMTTLSERFLRQHVALSRRHFLALGSAGIAAMRAVPLLAQSGDNPDVLQQAIVGIES